MNVTGIISFKLNNFKKIFSQIYNLKSHLVTFCMVFFLKQLHSPFL